MPQAGMHYRRKENKESNKNTEWQFGDINSSLYLSFFVVFAFFAAKPLLYPFVCFVSFVVKSLC